MYSLFTTLIWGIVACSSTAFADELETYLQNTNLDQLCSTNGCAELCAAYSDNACVQTCIRIKSARCQSWINPVERDRRANEQAKQQLLAQQASRAALQSGRLSTPPENLNPAIKALPSIVHLYQVKDPLSEQLKDAGLSLADISEIADAVARSPSPATGSAHIDSKVSVKAQRPLNRLDLPLTLTTTTDLTFPAQKTYHSFERNSAGCSESTIKAAMQVEPLHFQRKRLADGAVINTEQGQCRLEANSTIEFKDGGYVDQAAVVVSQNTRLTVNYWNVDVDREQDGVMTLIVGFSAGSPIKSMVCHSQPGLNRSWTVSDLESVLGHTFKLSKH